MKRASILTSTLLASLVLAGCGLKGSLYLPDRDKEQGAVEETSRSKRPTAPRPAPQSQKEDAARLEQSPSTAPADPGRPAEADAAAPTDDR